MKSSIALAVTGTAAIALLFLSANTEGKTSALFTQNGGVFSYEIHQDTIADEYYSDVFGPVPLSGTPADTCTIPLSGAYPVAAIQMPSVPVPVKYVYKVELMDAVQTLNVTVANNSAANLSSVQVTLDSLGTATISNLQGNSTGVAQFDVRNKEIDSVMNVLMTITPTVGGAFAAGNNLQVMFSLNGLTARKVDVNDSLLANYQRTFTNEYNFTDTVNVDYTDIADGFFEYSVTNHTHLVLALSIVHRNLWLSDFCQARNPPVKSIGDLTGLSFMDSVNAFNGDVAVRILFPPQTTNAYSKHNISRNRLFPEWNPNDSQSVTKIDYILNVAVYGRRVTLSASDSLSFVIKTTAFKYSAMSGTVMETLTRPSDSLKMAVPSSWNIGSSSDTFMCDYFTVIKLPDSAKIDTLVATENIFGPNTPDSNCQSSTKFAPAVNNALIKEQADLIRVLRQKPDSMYITGNITIPAGTHVVLVNDLTDPTDPTYSDYIGRMIIRDSLAFASAEGVVLGRTAPRPFACEEIFPVLRYSLPDQCRVSAEWFDMKGRLVYSYVNKTQGPGSYALSIPAALWSNGAYCMVFKAGDFVRKEKVVVVR